MASTFTGATSSISPKAGSNRKRVLSSGGDLPNPKKPKKQNRLDNLKADLKAQVGFLKDQLINFRKFLLDEQVAKKGAERGYIALLEECNTILQGENPTLTTLATFQVHFANQFESEEVLRIRMDQGVLPY